MESTIKITMLMNGDKIIAKMKNVPDSRLFAMSQAFILKEMMTEKGFSMFPVPAIPSSDDELLISMDSLAILPATPSDELLNLYSKLTSNLVLPKSNIIQ